MFTQNGIKLFDVRKALTNKCHFNNQFLGNGRYTKVRSVRCIQAMCIQLMYQIGIYALMNNADTLRAVTSADHSKLVDIAGMEKEEKKQTAYRFLKRKLLSAVYSEIKENMGRILK